MTKIHFADAVDLEGVDLDTVDLETVDLEARWELRLQYLVSSQSCKYTDPRTTWSSQRCKISKERQVGRR